MKTSEFDYNLPEELIAHEPAAERDQSRLMVLDRRTQNVEHRKFFNIVDYLNPGDLLVLNDTKVIPANLVGRKEEGGAKVEVLLTRSVKWGNGKWEVGMEAGGGTWVCLVRPGKRLKVGSRVIFGEGELVGAVLEKLETGEQIVDFKAKRDFWETVRKLGEIPLPPYIKPQTSNFKIPNKSQLRNPNLRKRYQTVYAREEGASAAPTAGLHFTPELLGKIKAKGVRIAHLTLHTGLATFRPVWTENVEDHPMHSEYFEIPEETFDAIKKTKRVIAVGTTSVRALETAGNSPSSLSLLPLLLREGEGNKRVEGELKGETNLFIYPGYKFKVVDAMITNFHWPRSTLIMLVSAFAGRDFIMRAYQEAIQQKYRLFSFGDAMLIL